MSRRALAVVTTLLLLAGCHRSQAVDAPDADADLRAKTAAKTNADLAAADAAARVPLPRPMLERSPARAPAAEANEPLTEIPDGNTSD